MRQHLVWGLLPDYWVGYSVNNRDIYLAFLGNYCKLRNPEGAVPERGKCQALLGMGNGAMSAGDPLARLPDLRFSLISQPRPLPTSSFASLSLLACHSPHFYLLCDLWQIPSLGLKPPLLSFEVYNWVLSTGFSILYSWFCPDQFPFRCLHAQLPEKASGSFRGEWRE